ncbi:MAG: cereblon family protein [Myxococcota bacterium]
MLRTTTPWSGPPRWCLRRAERTERGDEAPEAAAGGGPEPRRTVVCASCEHRLTEGAARIEVDGEHAHSFVNPHGLVFDVRCFARADGVQGMGALEHYWSWFPGYGWRVACCAGCGRHVGWLFERGGDAFAGLIDDRIREASEPSA